MAHPMCSDDWIFDAACRPEDLESVIRNAMSDYGEDMFTRTDGRVKLGFAKPLPGVYMVGRSSMKPFRSGPRAGWAMKNGRGWTDYGFRYSPFMISTEIRLWAAAQDFEPPRTSGTAVKGIRVMSLTSAAKAGVIPSALVLGDIMLNRTVLVFSVCPIETDRQADDKDHKGRTHSNG